MLNWWDVYLRKIKKLDLSKMSPQEIMGLFIEIDNRFTEYRPNKISRVEVLGWKGKGNIDIYRNFKNDFEVVEYIKGKETGEVKETHHQVLKEDFNRILGILRGLEPHTEYKCYYFAKKLGFSDWKALWKERHLYFKMYYFPIKVAEAMGIVAYSGRGTVVRLK